MTTLYMVEMDLSDRSRLAAWSEWYSGHLRKLLSVPGFLSAQRFQSEVPEPSPFLAIYELESLAVLDSPAYKSRGGPTSPGDWTAVMVNWRRNLFDGPARYSPVPDGGRLSILDDPGDVSFPCWPAVGLDRSVSARALAPAGTPGRPFRAITERFTS